MKTKVFKVGLLAAVLGIVLSYAACSDDFNYGSSSGQFSGLSGSESASVANSDLVGDSVQQYAGLVISKIYFTGSGEYYPTPSDTALIYDQYFRITNNSDTVIDAKDVTLLESRFVCPSTYYNFSDSISDQHFVTQVLYRINVSTPILPDSSIVIAYQANDLTDEGGLDLSDAAFDWELGPAPLLEKVFSYTKSIWLLHNRGFRSYAIAGVSSELYPDTTALINAGYKYVGTYDFTVGDTTYVVNVTDAYKIPNDWIIDAVNVVSPVRDERILHTLPYVLDGGETWAGNPLNSSDPIRFKHAVTRVYSGGKFVDTNNSTNDFTPNDPQNNPFIIP